MFEGATLLPKNKGWKCCKCGHREMGEESANRVLKHIKKAHPKLFKAGKWAMLPVR